MLLALDLGTTNIKAGIMDEYGYIMASAHKPTVHHSHPDGYTYFDPEIVWAAVAELICDVIEKAKSPSIRAIGITSMAESGLLVGRRGGKPRSAIIPWFETCAIPQADLIKQEIDGYEQFSKTGLHPSFKQGLAKILWLRERNPASLQDSVWLSVSAYVAYCLTGNFAEDYTLAARTFAFRITDKQWDIPLIKQFGLEASLFPPVVPVGAAVGKVLPALASSLGLHTETLVCLAGHDHVCASLAIGASEVYNSMGTAETMVGTLAERPINQSDYASGLAFGLHPLPQHMFWMGGHASSGGSVEWIRRLLGDTMLSYEQILCLLEQAEPRPSGILFYPYLSGSGLPQSNPLGKAAFIGLSAQHGKADMLKAILEGNAYQLETIRRLAETVEGKPIRQMNVVGGGIKNPYWLQIKADVSGIQLRLPHITEATLLGAALTAGVGAGVYSSFAETNHVIPHSAYSVVEPDPANHKLYKGIYERGFIELQDMLLKYHEWFHRHEKMN